MRRTAKIAGTILVSAALFGLGSAGATASASGSEAYQACIDKQEAVGLLNLDLNLLSQCIANYND